MQPQDRRTFLGRALRAGAGATVVAPFAGAAPSVAGTAARDAAPRPSDVDESFVAGEVVHVDGGVLKVVDHDGRARTVVVGDASHVWKAARFGQGHALARHDCIYARGDAVQRDGTLLVDRLWANITSFSGIARDRRARSLALSLPDGRRLTTTVTEATQSHLADGRTARGVEALAPEQPVQVIAFGDPATGRLTASRVVALDKPGTGSAATAHANTANVNSGMASYFCCGGVSGCGTCYGTSGQGACGGCRSDRLHMAWPKLTTGCGPYCDNCCLRATFPRLACDHGVQIRSMCRPQSATVLVKDCGPVVRCRSTTYGCGHLYKLVYDLTPCSFTAVGGGLESGLVDIYATS